jgi:5'-3' exonuclease
MLALVDSDTPIYSTALVSEDVSEAIAKSRLDVCISNIIRDSGCSEYKLFVSGGSNFRKEIDSNYKANRLNKPDPIHREALRLHLIKEWNAIECVGFEADDMCGVEQKQDGSTTICAIDKDLLQVPGLHYSWPITRKGVIVRQAMFMEVSVEQGWRNFFTQALTGDTSDNIKGIHGIGPKKSEKILEDCHTEQEMYEIVEFWYTSTLKIGGSAQELEQRLRNNLDLLWIWRELGITYSIRREIYG